jgi:hypothetical protein
MQKETKEAFFDLRNFAQPTSAPVSKEWMITLRHFNMLT